jgi:hypothetical protein
MNLPSVLEFRGPFTLSPSKDGDWPLASALNIPGVYLLAIVTMSGSLPYYAGESGNIADRMSEHLKEYLAGGYNMYESVALGQGEFRRRWEPAGVAKTVKHLEEVRRMYDGMIPHVHVLAAAIPNFHTKAERKIVESALILYYKSHPQTKGHFENGRVSKKYSLIGQSIAVTTDCPTVGLPTTLPV